jgi:redox-sensitive bicupin YhaK (pirin superfamily)
MSGTFPANEPVCLEKRTDSVALVIESRPRDLGGFAVQRALPSSKRRLVGPFVFFDHMGPAHLALGDGMDIRPHPHVGLATITYLFDGEIDHRDSLGSMQTIRPGDVNFMLAGRGIAHSERSSAESRRAGVHIHGIQSWVALPRAEEETEPRFEHHPAKTIPKLTVDGAELEVVLGDAYGARSPVGVLSPTMFVHARIPAGRRIRVDDAHEERAFYVVEGEARCDERVFAAGTMGVLRSGARVFIEAGASTARIVLVGGAPLDGARHIFWNFVSSSLDRIERAKADWQAERFPKIPGDDKERIPLPAEVGPSHTTA